MRVAGAFTCSLLMFACSWLSKPTVAYAGLPDVRGTLEVGPSFDYSNSPPGDRSGYTYNDARNGPNGFAMAGGWVVDRLLGPLGVGGTLGLESYPFRGPTRVSVGPPTIQLGVTNKSAFTFAEDIRIVFGSWHRKEFFLHSGIGWMWVHGEPREDRRVDTGELVAQYPGARFSGLMYETGGGIRTHPPTGCGWMLGVRARWYTDIINAATNVFLGDYGSSSNNVSAGEAVQVYVGVVTPRIRPAGKER